MYEHHVKSNICTSSYTYLPLFIHQSESLKQVGKLGTDHDTLFLIMTSHRLIDQAQADSVGPIPASTFTAQNSHCNRLFGTGYSLECQIGKFYDRRFGVF